MSCNVVPFDRNEAYIFYFAPIFQLVFVVSFMDQSILFTLYQSGYLKIMQFSFRTYLICFPFWTNFEPTIRKIRTLKANKNTKKWAFCCFWFPIVATAAIPAAFTVPLFISFICNISDVVQGRSEKTRFQHFGELIATVSQPRYLQDVAARKNKDFICIFCHIFLCIVKHWAGKQHAPCRYAL